MKINNIPIKKIGLQSYLDMTVSSHNSFGYDSFCTMLKNGVSKTSIAKAFGVSRFTILKWARIYNYEKDQIPK